MSYQQQGREVILMSALYCNPPISAYSPVEWRLDGQHDPFRRLRGLPC